jgi:hypothetical protein
MLLVTSFFFFKHFCLGLRCKGSCRNDEEEKLRCEQLLCKSIKAGRSIFLLKSHSLYKSFLFRCTARMGACTGSLGPMGGLGMGAGSKEDIEGSDEESSIDEEIGGAGWCG